MTKEAEIIKKLKNIFTKNFNQKISKVDTLKFGESKKWDSLRHIQIIISIEKEFNIKIKTSDVGQLTSFVKIKKYIINS